MRRRSKIIYCAGVLVIIQLVEKTCRVLIRLRSRGFSSLLPLALGNHPIWCFAIHSGKRETHCLRPLNNMQLYESHKSTNRNTSDIWATANNFYVLQAPLWPHLDLQKVTRLPYFRHFGRAKYYFALASPPASRDWNPFDDPRENRPIGANVFAETHLRPPQIGVR